MSISQEARRIVSAFHQHLTMSEWLPKVIGLKMMDKYDLLPRKQGFYEEYDSYCDGSIANEFATAAFRFGHTLIDANFHLKFKNESSEEPSILNLKDTFQNVDNIWKNPELMFEVLTGIVGMHSQNYDR